MKNLPGWFLILLFNPSLFSAAFSPTDSPDEIPFRLYRDYMVLVDGRIGTLGGLTFLVDTGTTSTLVNAGIARKLGLKGKHTKAVACGRSLNVERVILRELALGVTRFRSIPALIADFSVLPVIGNHIDVIIGMNALSRINFAIDYKGRKLRFNPEDSLESATKLETSGRSLVVQLQASGRPIRLMVDTGAKDLILFHSRLKGDRFWRSALKKTRIYNLSSSEELRMVQLYDVQLGEAELGNLRAFLLDGPIQGYAELHGILGVASLDLDRIQFDFDSRLLGWER